MARPSNPHPTELELEILKVLWRLSPATVRQVREALAPSRILAHTSVQTIMGIMVDKGYLERVSDPGEGNAHVYKTRISAQSVRRGMLKDLVRRAFDGSAVTVMLNLIDTADLDEDELGQLRKRLEEKKKKSQ